VKLGKTFKLLTEAYENKTMGRVRCYEWYQWFKQGRMSVEDDPR